MSLRPFVLDVPPPVLCLSVHDVRPCCLPSLSALVDFTSQVEDTSAAPFSCPPPKTAVINRMGFKVKDVVFIQAGAVDLDSALKSDE